MIIRRVISGAWASVFCLLVSSCLTDRKVVSAKPLSADKASRNENEYLDSAVGKGSEDEILLKLGLPSETRDLTSGDHVWVYKYKSEKSHLVFGRRWFCMENILMFDNAKKLRSWQRDRCPEQPEHKED